MTTKKVKVKPITLYFYRCSTRVGREMVNGVRSNVRNGIGPDQIFNDSRIQMQHLKIRDELMQGVMRRFDSENLPSVGRIDDQDEQPINMEENQYLTKKTHFLYDMSQGFLLYEQKAVSLNAFSSYVNVFIKATVKFEFVLTKRAIELLANKTLRVKSMAFKIARPTIDILAKVSETGLWWISSIAKAVAETNTNSLDLVMSGSDVRYRNKRIYLWSGVWDTISSLVGYLRSDLGDKGVVELYDEDGVHHPLDLITDRMKVVVSSEELQPAMKVVGNKTYIDSPKFLKIMKAKMEEARPQLEEMFDEEDD